MSETALVVIARYPEAGKTKTRLARSLGAIEVAELYRAFLTDLARRFANYPNATLHWAYTPAEVDYQALIDTLVPAHLLHTANMQYFPQEGDYFAARLHHVFQWTYAHGFQRTILIGSDLPYISCSLIDQANKALDTADVVLGPAEDGGYYLLGMHRPHDLFSAIPMSTDVVLHMTIERARQQELTVQLLETLFDIDELSELRRLAHLLQTDNALAPTTAAHLLTMKNML